MTHSSPKQAKAELLAQFAAALSPLGIDLAAMRHEAAGGEARPNGAALYARHFGASAAQAMLACLREMDGAGAAVAGEQSAPDPDPAAQLSSLRTRQKELMVKIRAELAAFGVDRAMADSFFASLDFDMGAGIPPLDESLPPVPPDLRQTVAAHNRALREAMAAQLKQMGQPADELLDALFADQQDPPKAAPQADAPANEQAVSDAARHQQEVRKAMSEQLKKMAGDSGLGAEIMAM